MYEAIPAVPQKWNTLKYLKHRQTSITILNVIRPKNFLSFIPYLFFIFLIFSGYLQADWTTSPTMIDSGNASSAAPLVVDGQGNVTSAWLENYDVIGDDPQAAFFSMALQEWTIPQALMKAGAGLATPQLIVDYLGTVTLVWSEFYSQNANSLTLFASRSTKGGPWTTPIPLNSITIPTNAQEPFSMVVDTQGNVTIVWLEQELLSSHYAIGAARFGADIDSIPTLYPFLDSLTPNACNTTRPQLTVDQLGYVTAVWQENSGSQIAIQAARLDPNGLSWTTATTLNSISPHAYNQITPSMVVDSTGVVTVVWQEITNSQYAVQAARFNPGINGAGGTWTTYTTIAPALDNALNSITPKLVVDKNNNVTIVAIDANLSVWPSSFIPELSSWTYPSTPLNTDIAFILTPLAIVTDSSGIVTIAWINNSAGLFVQAARGFSTSWSNAVNLGAGNAIENIPLLIVIDKQGTVTISWVEGTDIQAACYQISSSSWTSARTLNHGNVDFLITQKIGIGPTGQVTVIWQEGPDLNESYAIQAAQYRPESNTWTPATTLNGGTQDPDAFNSSMTQQINMVVDPFDNVTVTWLENVNASIAVQSARYTFTPHIKPETQSERMWLKKKE